MQALPREGGLGGGRTQAAQMFSFFWPLLIKSAALFHWASRSSAGSFWGHRGVAVEGLLGAGFVPAVCCGHA